MSAKGGKNGKGGGVTIVIRKEEVVEGGHHGGAWKVAYADFVTAMMAFFLLMWLLNATTEEQKRGIADYFSPNAFSRSSSGNGEPFGGLTPYENGSLVSDRGAATVIQGKAEVIPDVEEDDSDTPAKPRQYRDDKQAATQQDGQAPVTGPAARQVAGMTGARPSAPGTLMGNLATGSQAGNQAASGRAAAAAAAARAADEAALQAELDRRERAAFAQAAEQIRAAVRNDPNLADLGRQLAIDITPEGLRIQILDEDRQPMFATGSAAPNDRARLLLQKVTPVLQHLTEDISIAGHTDAAPYHGADRTNWELSAERANATRRLLTDAGLPESRIRSVTGNADRDPLLPAEPLAAANRRIAIVVLRAARPAQPDPASHNASPAPAPATSGHAQTAPAERPAPAPASEPAAAAPAAAADHPPATP